ncbi:MAG TPA: sigma 54-interacting transcriptional regulator [Clostridia bacterium]|nr:sigma 54-interacting transcriptional regulator [Clostridia bacterium]
MERHAVTSSVIKQWDEKLLLKILNKIQDVVLVIDTDTTIVYANEAYARILGVPIHKVLGRKLSDIEPEAAVIRAMREGKPSSGRDYIHSLGIHVAGHVFPLLEGDKIIGGVAVFNNISEIVRLNAELQRTKGVADYFKEQLNRVEPLPLSFQEYIGQNSRLKEVLHLAAKVAKTDSTVLILGESGVGKEVLAKAIHHASRRKDKPMIKVNCAAIPDDLLESELFGFEEGAFTGAKRGGKLGKFELAHEGTIFLDEIGDMSLSMQAKLLRVLQEKEIERIGGTRPIKVDFRVIAATNKDLAQMVKEGTFRQDLYYRLNIVPLYLPPLRERKDDIKALAQHFLQQFSKEVGHELILSPQVEWVLYHYDWPGNIRELRNVLEHASIVAAGPVIELQHLPSYLVSGQAQEKMPTDIYNLKESVKRLEKELILAALAQTNNNRSQAIKLLGISRRTFYEKLRQYDIVLGEEDS